MNKQRSLPGVVFLLSCLTAALAQAGGGMKIHMHGDASYAADGFLYMPSGQAPFPAIVLIPDEDGITQRVTDAAAALAEAGFIVVAVDLNRGVPPAAAVRTPQQIREDLDSTLSFLASQSSVRPRSVGALGFGSGGEYAIQLACGAKVRAAALEGMQPGAVKAAPPEVHAAVLTIPPAQADDARRLEREFFSKELGRVP